jgi:hypothetical protein
MIYFCNHEGRPLVQEFEIKLLRKNIWTQLGQVENGQIHL